MTCSTYCLEPNENIKMTLQDLPISIALVDDDEPILDAVTMVLENQGWQVNSYTNGERFLENVINVRPDLLVLDSHLPGLNGLEVIERMNKGVLTLPVIILTAHPASRETKELQGLLDTQILIKPVTETELLQRCRQALGLTN